MLTALLFCSDNHTAPHWPTAPLPMPNVISLPGLSSSNVRPWIVLHQTMLANTDNCAIVNSRLPQTTDYGISMGMLSWCSTQCHAVEMYNLIYVHCKGGMRWLPFVFQLNIKITEFMLVYINQAWLKPSWSWSICHNKIICHIYGIRIVLYKYYIKC